MRKMMMIMKSKNKTHKNIIQQKQVIASKRKSEPPMEPPKMAPRLDDEEDGEEEEVQVIISPETIPLQSSQELLSRLKN